MDEYIEREAAIRAVLNDSTEQVGYSREDAADCIRYIDAADVAPVRHGRWISKNPHGYEWTFVCSNCGYVDGYPFNDRHNYCPNCGAKMYGDSKEGSDNG